MGMIFWRGSLLGCLGLASVAVAGFGGLLQAGEPRLVGRDERRLLVLDTRVIESVENARLVLGEVTKEAGNPVMPTNQPWENATNNYYPNVLWDAREQVWKLWYKDVLADKEAISGMDAPSTVHEVGWYLLYATSKDGLHWQKPALGLHKFRGDANNNIVARDCPNAGVFKDERDPDPARRYKMVFDVGLGKPKVRFSPDGIHWNEGGPVRGFTAQQGDTHNNAFFDERSGRYLWFTKLFLGERLVTRLQSADFTNWRSGGVVLRSTVEEGRATQTYALTVFPYGNIYLGYVMMYHVGADRRVDVELAWSADSIHWQRVMPGHSFLRLGEKGSYDGGTIYAQAGPAVAQDGRLFLFYGGSPAVHTGWKRSAALCLARLREDGFAGYEPADAGKPAVLVTSPLLLGDEPLRLSADGEVAMEKLPEKDGAVRLRLTLHPGARLYAILGAALVNTAVPEPKLEPLPRVPVRRGPVVFSFDRDAQGWKGVDALAYQAEGYVTVSRKNDLRPFAHAAILEGDWPLLLGGEEAVLSARVRAPKAGGAVQVEIFANDLGQWSFEKLPPFATEWRSIEAVLRYDWTDEQAKAAGWTPAAGAFSWRDTIRHAGKVVIVAAQQGTQESFDLDDVKLEAR